MMSEIINSEEFKEKARSFLKEVDVEFQKYKKGIQKRIETMHTIAGIGINYDFLDPDLIDKDIYRLVELALDLEIPKKDYKSRGNLEKDMELFAELLEKLKKRYF